MKGHWSHASKTFVARFRRISHISNTSVICVVDFYEPAMEDQPTGLMPVETHPIRK